MKYSDIERCFTDPETSLEVLEECQPMFDRIDEIGTMLRDSKFANPLELDNLLKELNGLNIFLQPILGVAESTKSEEEDRHYCTSKMALEKNGEKVVSAVLEREASLAVANYRTIRNVIESYVKVVNTVIMSAQSLMRGNRDERMASNATS